MDLNAEKSCFGYESVFDLHVGVYVNIFRVSEQGGMQHPNLIGMLVL